MLPSYLVSVHKSGGAFAICCSLYRRRTAPQGCVAFGLDRCISFFCPCEKEPTCSTFLDDHDQVTAVCSCCGFLQVLDRRQGPGASPAKNQRWRAKSSVVDLNVQGYSVYSADGDAKDSLCRVDYRIFDRSPSLASYQGHRNAAKRLKFDVCDGLHASSGDDRDCASLVSKCWRPSAGFPKSTSRAA